jgi:hypothetical protein
MTGEAPDSSTGDPSIDFALAEGGTPSLEDLSEVVLDHQEIQGEFVDVPLGGVRVEALLNGIPLDPPLFTFTCTSGV